MNKQTFTQEYHALFTSTGTVKNCRKALPYLLVAARNGHPHAQNLVGYCYDLGLATSRNPRAAVRWYKKAAASDYSEAIYNLALCYATGRGTRKNVFCTGTQARISTNKPFKR